MTKFSPKAIAALAAVLLVGAAAPAAMATRDIFATSKQLYSTETAVGTHWDSTATYIQGSAAFTAYSGVWFVDAIGNRDSADAYCSSPGCVAHEGWSGSGPSGRGAVHNHGNGSPDYFTAYADY